MALHEVTIRIRVEADHTAAVVADLLSAVMAALPAGAEVEVLRHREALDTGELTLEEVESWFADDDEVEYQPEAEAATTPAGDTIESLLADLGVRDEVYTAAKGEVRRWLATQIAEGLAHLDRGEAVPGDEARRITAERITARRAANGEADLSPVEQLAQQWLDGGSPRERVIAEFAISASEIDRMKAAGRIRVRTDDGQVEPLFRTDLPDAAVVWLRAEILSALYAAMDRIPPERAVAEAIDVARAMIGIAGPLADAQIERLRLENRIFARFLWALHDAAAVTMDSDRVRRLIWNVCAWVEAHRDGNGTFSGEEVAAAVEEAFRRLLDTGSGGSGIKEG